MQHSDAKDAAAKEGRRQQMLRARADVEAQVHASVSEGRILFKAAY